MNSEIFTAADKGRSSPEATAADLGRLGLAEVETVSLAVATKGSVEYPRPAGGQPPTDQSHTALVKSGQLPYLEISGQADVRPEGPGPSQAHAPEQVKAGHNVLAQAAETYANAVTQAGKYVEPIVSPVITPITKKFQDDYQNDRLAYTVDVAGLWVAMDLGGLAVATSVTALAAATPDLVAGAALGVVIGAGAAAADAGVHLYNDHKAEISKLF